MEYLPRKIEKELKKWLKRKEVILIKGPRQSGKTTLLLQFQKTYGGKYISLEIDEYAEALKKDPILFGKTFGKEGFIYLDEAQYVKDVGKYVKILYDHFRGKIKLVITGSGSFEVKENLGKYLVGRAVYFELLPLSFEEFLLWKALLTEEDLRSIYQEYSFQFWDFLEGKEVVFKSVIFPEKFKTLWEEFAIFGGYPAIVKEEDKEIKIKLLKNLLYTYLEKDVFFFLNVRQMEKFKNLVKALALNIGNILEISSFSREFKMDFRTVEEYLSLLKHTYVIELVPPFYKSMVTELKKNKKAYFMDLGLRNAFINNFSEFETRGDQGALLENFVFSELRKRGIEVKYWRTTGKAEVDFVLHLRDKIIPVEAKISPKITRSLGSFLKAYTPKRGAIVSLNISKIEITTKNSTEIIFFPCFYF